ncbi:heme-degrading domain-containing protein [Cryobacterium sp. 1639]|uniref:heme-degrading domain-containing protein n=1 Tax=Cryobacterium inferilacus TaxID=2866629 RepID=UPI001C73AC7D|nr:heme-degrading domain-containing protein [Cryobacterium sp. 1639]MBX0300382.1 heme-degrading domain-containing protein [Cryobacterium sp. 1639]
MSLTPDPAAQALLPLLEEQNARIGFTSFDYDDAYRLGSAIMARAAAEDLRITVTMSFGEQRVFHAARPGTTADNDDWLARKFRVVSRYNVPSFLVSTKYRARGQDFNAATGLPITQYVAAGGAFPLRVNGSLIGAVGVSGLVENLDHDLVVWALEAAQAAAA